MILFFNPLSTTPGKQPLPLSIMALAAVLEGKEAWCLVDGNIASDPAREILERVRSADRWSPNLLAVTVMPGPQLAQALPVCKAVRKALPNLKIAWGGYFPTQHAETVLASGVVDFVVRSQGELPLCELIEALKGQRPFESVGSLTWRNENGSIVKNASGPMTALDDLPDYPYERVEMERYIHPTYLGNRTIAHNSSFGCPFACSFCAVGAMTNRRWLAQSPTRVSGTLERLQRQHGIDSVMFHDMDFFISEARVAEIAERLIPSSIKWWALGRIDTLMRYSDRTWDLMARSGLKMVFSGAESSSEATLELMNKGGTASPQLALDLAKRMKHYGVVPEYSFVLGSPPDPEGDTIRTFDFVRRIKSVNPATEIILYTYTPVPGDGAMFTDASSRGFAFPETLDGWASDEWRQAMMRRGDHIPWMVGPFKRRVRNFERVLNAFYPTVTDRRLTPARRALLRAVSAWRYYLRIYSAPYELRAMQRLMHYQRPETTGF